MRIDGREIAEKIYERLRNRVEELKKKNILPHLVVILVGVDPASVAYVNQKQKHGEAIGAKVTVQRYDENVTNETLVSKIKELDDDPSVHAILVQRPLPEHIDVSKLELLTDSQKDIDGFHPDSPYTLPLPLAVIKILQVCHSEQSEESQPKKDVILATQSEAWRHPESLKGNERDAGQASMTFLSWLSSKNIVVIGKGPTGGGPVIAYLNKLGINPQIIDSKTPNPQDLTKQADIIISSVGRENIVRPEMLKKGVILESVGIFRGEDGKLHGDYDEEAIKDIASFYTPTPGGVGPVNVAMLMENLLDTTGKQSN